MDKAYTDKDGQVEGQTKMKRGEVEAKDEGKRYRTGGGGGGTVRPEGEGSRSGGRGERIRMKHRVHRVPGFPFNSSKWVPHTPHLQAIVAPPIGSKGEDTIACGGGG